MAYSKEQIQDRKDSAQRQANLDWCIQQALLTGKCLSSNSEDGGVTASAQCKAYRAAFPAPPSHYRAYNAGIAAYPSLVYLRNPYSKSYAPYTPSNNPLSPEAAFAAVPPFIVEGSGVLAGIGCPFAPSGSTAASPGFIANATFTYGTDEAANVKGIAAATAAVQAAANAANLSKENSDILIKKMIDAIARRRLNKKPTTKPTGNKGPGKKPLTKLKGKQ